MKIYNDVLKKIMEEGVDREGRNGSTRALFAVQIRFNLKEGFPAVTTKKLAFKAVKSELLWFLDMKGKDRASDEDLKKLNQSERTIWTDNAEASYWLPKSKFKATSDESTAYSGAIGKLQTDKSSTRLQK